MESIDRVFFHELGHFVAQEINYCYYGSSGISQFLIYPCEEDPNIFCGHVTPIVPQGVDSTQDVALEALPRHIASLIYGCTFQAYYLKNPDPRECLTKNGAKDAGARIVSIDLHKPWEVRKEFSKVEDEHYKYLVEGKFLDPFMQLNPENYLSKIGYNTYEVNIDSLRADTENMIIDHFESYDKLISKFKSILGLE